MVFFVNNFDFTLICLTKIDERIINSLKKSFSRFLTFGTFYKNQLNVHSLTQQFLVLNSLLLFAILFNPRVSLIMFPLCCNFQYTLQNCQSCNKRHLISDGFVI